jgi:hypothetical protein
LFILGLAIISIRNLHPFLAISHPVPGGIIAIEGWILDTNVERSVHSLDARHARDVFIVSAINPSVHERESGREHSEYMASNLRESGVPAEKIHLIFFEISKKDRTYHTAMALRGWLQERGLPVDTLNVITMGAHARRSRLLFQKAFGDNVKVGVIPIDDPNYDPVHWWRSSDGVGQMIFQGFAYMYARFFFRP